jgi:lipid-A-disaccharide synthase
MLSCAEASGDLYAGALTRELRAIDPAMAVFGLGGPQFAAAGGTLIDDYRDIAVTGLTEAIAKIPRSFAALRRLVGAARTERPAALVVIDSPDFNFRLARQVKKLGVPIIYYISPQIWAWRAWRLKTIRGLADRVLVIFPFEEAIYREGGVPVEFVGHPLVDLATPARTRNQFLQAHGLSASARTIAILPGSRPNEVSLILPDLIEAAQHIRAAVPDAQFVVARAPHLNDRLFAVVPQRSNPGSDPSSVVRDANGRNPFVVVEGDTDTVLASADLALTASGTATVQAALHDTPMVIVYRLSPMTYRVGRRLVTVDSYGMVNLIAGEKIVPEFVQHAFTPDAVAREAVTMLTTPARAAQVREGLARVRARLGGPGASRRAAEAILRVVEEKTRPSTIVGRP